MDPFDPIRARAAELHEQVVITGASRLDPARLAQGAVDLLDLIVVKLNPDDPALKGARAVFDEQSGTICCEESASAIESVLLIAHEIGHASIHAGSSSCTGADIDPSRSTEAAPVGLQRVVDYGVRERRELQANVFAREFLLPRCVARRLHVDEELGAAHIARRTGLPLNLVRQQLFDALLLPQPDPPVPLPSATDTQHIPDVSQSRAATHRGSPLLLQAGPGTGKTRTLILRVLGLLAEGVDPASILILTFSNRAAGELTERIAAVAPEAAARIWTGTFHAFGLDLLRRLHDRLGLSPSPPLFDRSDAIAVLEEMLPTLSLKHYRDLWHPELVLKEIIAAVSRAKDELVDPVRYRKLAESMHERADDETTRKAAEKCLEIAGVYESYENELRLRGAVDFGDLIMRPALLLEADESLRLSVQLRHRHVLVDEYQDVNRASARLLKAVAGEGKRLWVVGDARQSIYRFRGASSANMSLFREDYPGAAVDQLAVNYRSTSQIVEAFSSVAPHMGASSDMLPLKLTAQRGQGPGQPEVRCLDTAEEESACIAASVRELEKVGVALRSQAVLCRSNGKVNEIAAALEVRGIPVLHLGSLFERNEIRDLLALLSLAVDPFGDGLMRVGAMQRYGLSLQDAHVATHLLQRARRPAPAGLLTLTESAEISTNGRTGVARLAEDLGDLAPGAYPWDVLAEYMLDRTNLGRSLGDCGTAKERLRAVAVWQFLNFVREKTPVRSGTPIRQLLDRVRSLVLLAEERDLRQVPAAALGMDAVRLMTVHGSKGLEFEAVHLPGLNAQVFPLSYRGQRCPPPEGMIEGSEKASVSDVARQTLEHEEQCLFFVALSRSKSYLRMYYARRQASGNARKASRFLDWIPFAQLEAIGKPDTLDLPAGERRAEVVRLSTPEGWEVTDSSLGAYERCPRRFFYTHVFGLKGGQKTTAFSRTHDCLYDLMRWLKEERRQAAPTMEEAERAFEEIWHTKGPCDHAFAAEYRQIASRLIGILIRIGEGSRYLQSDEFAVAFSTGTVVVKPNEVIARGDGSVVLRRVRTGYKRTSESSELAYALYQLAGEAHFEHGVKVEAVHLTDDVAEPVELTERVMKNRRAKCNDMLGDIRAGQFPAKVNAVTCPRCPHFFVCPANPQGELTIS